MKSHNISEIRTNGDLLDQLSCHEVEPTFPNPALLNHCSDKDPWVVLVNVSLEDMRRGDILGVRVPFWKGEISVIWRGIVEGLTPSCVAIVMSQSTR